MNLLFLSREEIKRLVTDQEVLEVVEEAFRDYAQKEMQMPSKVYLFLPEYKGDFRAMPVYWKKKKYAGIKWVNAHFENFRYSLPSVMALFLLNSAETGRPLAVMEMAYLTSLRTAASAAIASKYLAYSKSSSLGIIGLGEQSIPLLRMHLLLFPIQEVWVYDIDTSKKDIFMKKSENIFQGKIIFAKPSEILNHVHILITVTPSQKPFLFYRDLSSSSPLSHINAMGADAPGKMEIDASLIKKAKVIVDDIEQASHGGEIHHVIEEGKFSPQEIYATLGEILLSRKAIPRDSLTLFDSTGLAIQDIAVASLVYEKALREGMGKKWSFM